MLASPLNDLTQKVLPDRIRWSEADQKTFETLREALWSEPVLITPDFAFPLIVHTDASEVGLRGVLSQVRAGEEHPITAGNSSPMRGTIPRWKRRPWPSSGPWTNCGIIF